MPGPIQRGRAFVERILSDGVETVNTESISIAEDVETIVPGDDLADTVNDVNNKTFFVRPGTYTLSERLELGDGVKLIGVGAAEQTVIEAPDGFGANLASTFGQDSLIANLEFNHFDPDGVSVIRDFSREIDRTRIVNCRFFASGSTDAEYYIRLSSSNASIRGCHFGPDDDVTNNTVRQGGEENTYVGCTNFVSFDDRGTNNVTAGNTPLDTS